MYFHDRPLAYGYTTPPSDEDLKYMCAEWPDVNHIAGMRQTLDCILFQLAPVSGPLQISEKEFTQNLVGMLPNQGSATVAMAMDRCRMHGVEIISEMSLETAMDDLYGEDSASQSSDGSQVGHEMGLETSMDDLDGEDSASQSSDGSKVCNQIFKS